ncbi:MAG TPA: type II secretion system protein [Dehalococcoidia bacterium]|jgi:prepilin-type N-terminal cleavage/methylation domain-containing protein|nr:type II secretion system protein [Dehalococcoidia bacterium]
MLCWLSKQRGFSLIEILVGLALLGLIGVAVLSGLTTTFRGVSVSEERVTADSLARSQIEYIKIQDYVQVADYNPDDPANRYELIDIPADLAAAGYSVEINPPELVLSGNGGFELQSITVAVRRNDQLKLSVEIYRVND